jgi:hypothetical protein
VFYGSNPHRKDNPRWPTSNEAETSRVPSRGSPLLLPAPTPPNQPGGHLPKGIADTVIQQVRSACGIASAWLIGLPRRAGRRLHAVNDAEASRWNWLVVERCGGLVHQYRDARFDALRNDPTLRRDELRDGHRRNGTQPPSADCPSGGDA